MSETNVQATTQGDPEQLGDAGKAALVAERKRADDAEKRVKELEAQVTAQVTALTAERDKAVADGTAKTDELQAKVSELEKSVLERDATIGRLNVGIDAKLPRDLIDRLRGDDETALRADAESLKAFVPGDNPFPKADPSQGATDSGGGTTADKFASFFEASTS